MAFHPFCKTCRAWHKKGDHLPPIDDEPALEPWDATEVGDNPFPQLLAEARAASKANVGQYRSFTDTEWAEIKQMINQLKSVQSGPNPVPISNS